MYTSALHNAMYLRFRYHYNVADTRLAEHVEKGNEDGLYISCVASCSGLWAIIMDAGTNFTSQVYELSPLFLHKVNVNYIYSTMLMDPSFAMYMYTSNDMTLVHGTCIYSSKYNKTLPKAALTPTKYCHKTVTCVS